MTVPNFTVPRKRWSELALGAGKKLGTINEKIKAVIRKGTGLAALTQCILRS